MEDKAINGSVSILTVGAGATLGYIGIKNAPEKIKKFAGPLAILAGFALQFTDNGILENLGLGMAATGVLETADQYAPETLKTANPDYVPALGMVAVEVIDADVDYEEEDDELDAELEALTAGESGAFERNMIEGVEDNAEIVFDRSIV